jgi:hypothetical protein
MLRAKVIKRPSASIKSPYVADIEFEDGRKALCHTPCLGCCGLVEAGRTVYVSAGKQGTKAKPAKTEYTVQLAECTDETGIYVVGVHPLVAQKAARDLLVYISQDATWKAEVRVDDHTRLDYVGIQPNGKKIYVEVKCAMISMQCHIPRCKRRAIFPEGYRKKKSDTISPRAVKHAETLAELMKREDTDSCVLLFVVPRHDCESGLEINTKDPTYNQAVDAARRSGVQVRAFSFNYSVDGSIVKNAELEVYV